MKLKELPLEHKFSQIRQQSKRAKSTADQFRTTHKGHEPSMTGNASTPNGGNGILGPEHISTVDNGSGLDG
jgi:hypothetical protein